MPISPLLKVSLIIATTTLTALAQDPSPSSPTPPATTTAPTIPAELPPMPLDKMPAMPPAIPIAVTNGSFENGLDGWTAQEGSPAVFTVSDVAASMGHKGLSVQSNQTATARLVSSSYPVEAGKIYDAQFWGRARAGNGVSVGLVFCGADDKPVDPVRIKGGAITGVLWERGHFVSVDLRCIAPTGATSLKLMITGDKNGTADVDDVHLWELPAANTPVPIDVAALKAELAVDPTRGQPLPRIIIKLDDLIKMHPAWQKVVDFMKSKGDLKVNFGIICNSLENGTPDYIQWIKDTNATGEVEFWNHGYDHGINTVNGVPVQEFKQPYDYQKKHMDDAQRLAVEKLGFPLTVFGAPYNITTEDTVRVMSETPEIKVWMYGNTAHPAGKVVLERLGVTLENPTFIPDFEKFLDNYVHNRGFPYFCMQGHPEKWDAARFDDFTEIIDFLVEQKASFVHASEMTAKDVVIPGFETLYDASATTPPPTK